ncbi:MAG: hypothetical protein IKR74_01500 [Bacilli bacterium]|nr:hypothetical protein [Bacilli bacterium]
MSNLLIDNKKLMNEYNYEKNNDINLNTLTLGTDKKIWWKCKKGHEWLASINHRNKGRNCPYCSNQKVLKGYNDLATTNPEILINWNYENNYPLTPHDVIKGSERKVWWKCEKGHEWMQSINKRSINSVCPYCSNQKVLKGYNDIVTTDPEIAKEWNYEKNYPLTPDSVVVGSGKKVWWKCEKGHEWETSIYHRKKGTGCPICGQKQGKETLIKKMIFEKGSLAENNPELSKEWNYEKNGFGPETVMINTNKKVWWKCDKGHEWLQSPNVRSTGVGCPYCASQKILVGYNDLLTTNPRLAKEWNYEKNGFGPETVMEHTNKKVWWKCDKGHEWEASINSRGAGSNCPICSKEFKISFPEKTIYYYIKQVFGDAIENYRDISIENKEIDIFIPSKKIGIEYDGDYWHVDDQRDVEKDKICNKQEIIIYRIREPHCKKLKTSHCLILTNRTLRELEEKISFLINNLLNKQVDINIDRDKNKVYGLMNYQERKNSLAYKCPNLIEEWDYEKNYPLQPSQVSAGSNKKVWWICATCGYNWETKICHRSDGHNCPKCSLNMKEVEQYDIEMNYIQTFKSITQAEKTYNIQHIREVCNGQQKTAGGYIWKYKQ